MTHVKKKYIQPHSTWAWLGLQEGVTGNYGDTVSGGVTEEEVYVKGEADLGGSTDGSNIPSGNKSIWDEEW